MSYVVILMSFQTISSIVVDPRLTVHVLKGGSWCNVGKTENRRCIVEYCFVPKKGVVRSTTSAWNKVLQNQVHILIFRP